jgi:hypothetical protein
MKKIKNKQKKIKENQRIIIISLGIIIREKLDINITVLLLMCYELIYLYLRNNAILGYFHILKQCNNNIFIFFIINIQVFKSLKYKNIIIE